jgi:nucleoside-diphosphate-sugar epimerase
MHLAGLSNDPLGDLNPGTTYDINHQASVRLAAKAKEAGVSRFIFSSSCSNYGAAGDDLLDESAEFNPVTPYGESKVMVERDVSAMADDKFSPTYLRNATAYGLSVRLRGDLVVNNLTGYAFTSGEVLIKSDGTPWRPLVHIEDISRAFVAVLHAPREKIHNEAFNVGRNEENYRVSEIADMVEEIVPNSHVTYAEGAGPDKRNYRVDCSKIMRVLPEYKPTWTVRKGVVELYEAYKAHGLTYDEFLSSRYLRIKHVRELQEQGNRATEVLPESTGSLT